MITILDGGFHSLIQDLGRTGYQQYGVIVSGAMDRYALRIANLLVGNHEDEAGIEITFGKTAILFHDERVIAITGGHLKPELNGNHLHMNRPYYVNKGDILKLKTPSFGLRAYVAISGGIATEKVLGSKSTYEKAAFGGWEGRTLKRSDEIPLGPFQSLIHKRFTANPSPINWSVNTQVFYSEQKDIIPIHVLLGLDAHLFQQDSILQFEQLTYTISNQSNRMGYHLENSFPINLDRQQEILSEAVAFGTVQVPPSGKPMILMADAQTVGGYPKIAQVISTDFSRLAQALPGQQIHFKFVDIQTAQEKLFEYEKYMRQIKYSIRLHTKPFVSS